MFKSPYKIKLEKQTKLRVFKVDYSRTDLVLNNTHCLPSSEQRVFTGRTLFLSRFGSNYLLIIDYNLGTLLK